VFPARGKKFLVNKRATRATVEKMRVVLKKEIRVEANRSLRLLLGAALTGGGAYVVAVRVDKIRSEREPARLYSILGSRKLLIHRENPYDVQSTIELEWQQGMHKIVRSWWDSSVVAVFILAVGTRKCFLGLAAMDAVSVASLILAMRLSWNMFGKGENTRSVFLFADTFCSVLACLEAAQIGSCADRIVAFMVFETEQTVFCGRADSAVCKAASTDFFLGGLSYLAR